MHDREHLGTMPSATAGEADDERSTDLRPSRARRRGRPRVTVFSLRPGVVPSAGYRARRALALARFHGWEDRLDDRLISPPYRIAKHPDQDLYRAADFAMMLLEHRPRRLDSEEMRRGALPTFNREAAAFIDWLRTELESNWKGRRGPKPDFRKTCKTALSLAVARTVLCSWGRHYRYPPTPREIADVWLTLFKEEERYDSIKHRLRLVGELCKQFATVHHHRLIGGNAYFRKAGDAVLRKLAPISPKAARRSTK